LPAQDGGGARARSTPENERPLSLKHASWAPDCAAFQRARGRGDTIGPTEDAIRDTLASISPPTRPHDGVFGSTDEERAAWRARFRSAFRAFAIHARGEPSGIERAFEQRPTGLLFTLLSFLALDEFPAPLRGDDTLGEPAIVAEYRAAIARTYCRALTTDEAVVRLGAMRRSGHDDPLQLDPFERYGLGPVLARLLEAPDRETRLAALDRLCGFHAPPTDSRTVAALNALVREPAPQSLDVMPPNGCVAWLLASTGTDEGLSALIDQVFTKHGSDDARCALARRIRPRHAKLVRAAYRRAPAGYSFQHVSPPTYAAPILSTLGLTDVVRDDLRSSDGDRVYRGVTFAAWLAPRDGIPLLEEVVARTDLPDAPPGEHRDWGGKKGLENAARDTLEFVRGRERTTSPEGPVPLGCEMWACNVNTHGLTRWPACRSAGP
jgi:hypothetical protein